MRNCNATGIIAVLLALAMLVSLTGCFGREDFYDVTIKNVPVAEDDREQQEVSNQQIETDTSGETEMPTVGDTSEQTSTDANVSSEAPADEQEKVQENENVPASSGMRAYFDKRIADAEKVYDDFVKVCDEGYQQPMNIASYECLVEWDELLNEVYSHLKITLDAETFEAIKQDEIEWIKRKESAVEQAGKDWEGGSGQPFAENTTALDMTKDRVYYLVNFVK